MKQFIQKINVASMVMVLLASLLLMSIASGYSFTFAQEGTTTGSGLRVSPTRSEVNLINGDSREVIQTVRNVTPSPVTVEPNLNDFESDGTTGQPKLVGDPEDVSAYSLREFVTLPQPFELQPEEEQEVKITIRVPDNASPGAYFGSVLYRASPIGASGDGQVALVASVGSLLLVEVPGEITEQVSIDTVSAYLDGNSGSLFTQKPDEIGILVDNLGNGFARPFGKVAVTDWRGNTVFSYELNDADRRKNVLPESTRLFTQELFNIEEKTVNGAVEQTKTSPITWPGKYTITGNLSHGTSGELIQVTASFWYIPAWLILVIVILVVLLVGGAFMMHRKYNKSGGKKRGRRRS